MFFNLSWPPLRLFLPHILHVVLLRPSEGGWRKAHHTSEHIMILCHSLNSPHQDHINMSVRPVLTQAPAACSPHLSNVFFFPPSVSDRYRFPAFVDRVLYFCFYDKLKHENSYEVPNLRFKDLSHRPHKNLNCGEITKGAKKRKKMQYIHI